MAINRIKVCVALLNLMDPLVDMVYICYRFLNENLHILCLFKTFVLKEGYQKVDCIRLQLFKTT